MTVLLIADGRRPWWPTLRSALAAAAILGVLFVACRNFAGQEPPDSPTNFVKVRGNQLELHCRPFLVAGFNTHDLVQNAMLTGTDYDTSGGLSGDQMVKDVMKQAQRARLNVIRTWAHTNHQRFPFQVRPAFCACSTRVHVRPQVSQSSLQPRIAEVPGKVQHTGPQGPGPCGRALP